MSRAIFADQCRSSILAEINQPMHDNRPQNHEQRSAALLWIVLALAALAAVAFIARGPLRGLSNPSDFILIYGPARTWMMGKNPYDQVQIDHVWAEAHGPPELAPSNRTAPNLLYPPTTLLLLAPFAALPWPTAHHAWLIASVACLAIVLWCTARLAGFRLSQRRTWLLVAGGLLFAPVHTTIHHGQTPLYVMALMLPAFALGRAGSSGFLLGLASAFKPQMGMPALALEGVRARWRSVLVGAATIAVVLFLSVLPMMMHRIPWWHSWQDNLTAHRTRGAADPSSANTDRHQMINLQYPITALTENKTLAEIGTLAVCGAVAVAFFLPPRRRMLHTSLLHALSMVSVLALMVVYHRFYDAVLLLVVLAWSIDGLSGRRRSRLHWITLAMLVPYFLNSATALVIFERRGWLPSWLTESWWWERVLLPHQGWALVAMAMCLLIAQRRRLSDGTAATVGAAARS